MRTWHFYDLQTGIFSGRLFSARSETDLQFNTPEGFGAREGVIDWESQRVDLATGELVDYQPPAPDSDHEWVPDARRWVLKLEVADRRARRAAALSQIEALETKQLRSLRELVIDPNNTDAASRLAQIESEIAELRRQLT